jgi:alpha-L-fucosidase 2
MRYNTPANIWNNALPLGNGRLGAMVYGYTGIERIQLNEDSLWYGGFLDRNNQATFSKLEETRKLVLEGNIRDAETNIIQYFCGAPVSQRHYEPLGELDIALNTHTPFQCNWFPNSNGATDYEMALDLFTGILSVDHESDNVHYHREMFISHEHKVLALKLTASKAKAINLDIKLDRSIISDECSPDGRRPGFMNRSGPWAGFLADDNHAVDNQTLLMKGNSAGTLFATAVRVVTDGVVSNPYSQLFVRDATSVTLLLSASTSNRAQDPSAQVLLDLDAIANLTFEELKEAHIKDFSSIMEACQLTLEGPENTEPLDVRMEDIQDADLPSLSVLGFQFGRYLLAAGGREDSAALNLQGIWCKDFVPAWDSKYTININTQMNYWPAEVTNMSRLHQSLFSLIEKMEPNGEETARVMYHCRGTMCHHNTDYYGDCAPQDVYMASTQWVTGGAWLALHIWDHYQFTKDREFLKKYYPLLKNHALFFVDFLSPDGKGQLVTNPALSPENRYLLPDGFDTPICAGPTMDNQIVRSLFQAVLESAEILGIDEPEKSEFVRVCNLIPKNQVGSQGQLLEWSTEVPEMTPGMAHISHLWGSYPGNDINWKDSPDILKAAQRSLEIRLENGAGHGGWPLAWFISQAARFGRKDLTSQFIDKMIRSMGTRNFFNGRGIFQIDGNFGLTAGIAETLIQSHTGVLELLPALPETWKSGEVTGLRARGSLSVDMKWNNGTLTKAQVSPDFDTEIQVRGKYIVSAPSGEIPVTQTPYGIEFSAKAGNVYTLA